LQKQCKNVFLAAQLISHRAAANSCNCLFVYWLLLSLLVAAVAAGCCWLVAAEKKRAENACRVGYCLILSCFEVLLLFLAAASQH
jgi:uncharacterized membrane protein